MAVQTIWSVNAVSALVLVLGVDSGEGNTEALALNLLILSIYAMVTWMVGAGENWARTSYAVLVAMEVALLAAFGMDSASDLDLLATYLTTPLEFWALYKLYSAESEPWFNTAQRH
jgi:hypothetical protein